MDRPNILLLYTDQQRWDALGASGNPEIQTPNLDRLAADGLNYDHYFVQCPTCMPSRMSMLSGLYPATVGVMQNGAEAPRDLPTLPRLLKPYGYRSANIGKLHFLNHANRDHRDAHPDYGFDHMEISDEPGCYEDAYRAWVRRQAPDQLDHISLGLPGAAATWQKTLGIDDGIVHPGERFPKRALAFRGRSDMTHTAFVAEQVMDFLRAHRDERHLCIGGFYSPHSPWVAPQEFLDLYDPAKLSLPEFPEEINAKRSEGHFSDDELRSARHGYYAIVSEVDHHVGRILACLDELGLRENTIVIFTSDHGEWLGEHLMYGKGYPGLDCVSRVPFIVRWPRGIAAPGRAVSGLVEAVDVVPSLLEWCGIPVPPRLQGRAMPIGPDLPPGKTRDSVLIEMEGWKALRTERFHYTLRADGVETLRDLGEDPSAYRDLADDPACADTLAGLRRELARRLIERERPRPLTWCY